MKDVRALHSHSRLEVAPVNPTPTPSTPGPLTREQSASRPTRLIPHEVTEVTTSSGASGEAPHTAWDGVRRWVAENTFHAPWLPEPFRRPIAGYALAVTLAVVASLLTLLLATISPSFSFFGLLNIFVIAVVALTYGAAPSLLATIVSTALLELLVLPQKTHDDVTHTAIVVEVIIFLVVGALIGVLASGTEQARRRAVSDHAVMEARELALRETNARTDEFLSIASHELRSPLTSLKAALQLGKRRLRRLGEQPQPVDDLLSQIEVVQGLLSTAEQQVDRQDRLVGDLLDVSRIRANKLEFRLAPCDLVSIVSDTVDEQRLSWPDRSITLDAPAEPLMLEADEQRIGQVVTNFLTNALKYSPPDAPVAVSLRVEGDLARVAVRDQGPGLSAEQQAHIWDRFHRVPGIKQQSGSGAGLGLGLHISRTIIEYHDGAMGITSAPRQGSTFWFTLPLRHADA
jgi:signal transduction histidine kinase